MKQPTRIAETSKTLTDIICTNNERTASDTIAEPSAVRDYDSICINRKMNCQKYFPRKISQETIKTMAKMLSNESYL